MSNLMGALPTKHLIFVLLFICLLPIKNSQGEDVVEAISNGLRDAVVHLKVVQDYGDGRQETLDQGSGVLVGDHGYVLTSKHLFNKVADPDLRKKIGQKQAQGVSILIKAIQGAHEGTEFSLNYVDEANLQDFSLLQFSRALPEKKWPCFRIGDPSKLRQNSELLVLGFSGGRFTTTLGRVATLDGPENTYKMDTPVAGGGSGGPVVDLQTQKMVGIVRGKLGNTDFNLFTPINLAASVLKPAGECESEKRSFPITIVVVVLTAESVANGMQSFQVDETNDDHQKQFNSSRKCYERLFESLPGYQIVSTNFEKASATRESDLTFNILEGGSRASMRFCLTAGPKVDRYRGWIHGVLRTSEVKVIPPERKEVGKLVLESPSQLNLPVPQLSHDDKLIILGENGETIGAGLAKDEIQLAGTCISLRLIQQTGQVKVTCN